MATAVNTTVDAEIFSEVIGFDGLERSIETAFHAPTWPYTSIVIAPDAIPALVSITITLWLSSPENNKLLLIFTPSSHLSPGFVTKYAL